MNTFNSVFSAIKEYSKSTHDEVNERCFGDIAQSAGIAHDKLDFYLKTLKRLGLINYSRSKHFIRLTAFGERQDRLFADDPVLKDEERP